MGGIELEVMVEVDWGTVQDTEVVRASRWDSPAKTSFMELG